MADIKYLKYRSYCPELAQLHGKKPSKTDRLIGLRSDLTHTEIQFTDRYGNISFSATMADDCRCARFKMIGYSHPERWLTVLVPVTAEQEALIFAKACEMADVDILEDLFTKEISYEVDSGGVCFYGNNALKYDLQGVSLSFISKWRVWRPHDKWVWCTEACFIAMMAGFLDILEFGTSEYVTMSCTSVEGGDWAMDKVDNYLNALKPDDLHPSRGDMIIRNYVRKLAA
jgi:hypothetical protein